MFKKIKKNDFKIGLDLGSSSVKIVGLQCRDNNFLLRNFIIKEIPYQSRDVSGLVKEGLLDLGAQHSPVNISLSGQGVITRYVSFPIIDQRLFRNSLRFETQQYIPFSIEEVNLDGYILKQDAAANKMSVLIAAAKKELVSERVKLVQDLGFKVGIVDIDSLALINAFSFSYAQDETLKQKTIALLNIGASVTNLDILEQGMPCLSRDIQISGNNFTERIADGLGVDLQSAESLKINPGKEDLDKIKPYLDTILSQLAQEIRNSFDYYESQSASSVEQIFISGGGSLLAGLVSNLNAVLGVEIQTWGSLNNLELSEGLDIEKIKVQSMFMPVALGLAIR